MLGTWTAYARSRKRGCPGDQPSRLAKSKKCPPLHHSVVRACRPERAGACLGSRSPVELRWLQGPDQVSLLSGCFPCPAAPGVAPSAPPPGGEGTAAPGPLWCTCRSPGTFSPGCGAGLGFPSPSAFRALPEAEPWPACCLGRFPASSGPCPQLADPAGRYLLPGFLALLMTPTSQWEPLWGRGLGTQPGPYRELAQGRLSPQIHRQGDISALRPLSPRRDPRPNTSGPAHHPPSSPGPEHLGRVYVLERSLWGRAETGLGTEVMTGGRRRRKTGLLSPGAACLALAAVTHGAWSPLWSPGSAAGAWSPGGRSQPSSPSSPPSPSFLSWWIVGDGVLGGPRPTTRGQTDMG